METIALGQKRPAEGVVGNFGPMVKGKPLRPPQVDGKGEAGNREGVQKNRGDQKGEWRSKKKGREQDRKRERACSPSSQAYKHATTCAHTSDLKTIDRSPPKYINNHQLTIILVKCYYLFLPTLLSIRRL
jgi:hypothetical protein